MNAKGASAEACVGGCLSPAGRGLDGRRQKRLSGRPAHGHAGGAAPAGHAVHGRRAAAGTAPPAPPPLPPRGNPAPASPSGCRRP